MCMSYPSISMLTYILVFVFIVWSPVVCHIYALHVLKNLENLCSLSLKKIVQRVVCFMCLSFRFSTNLWSYASLCLCVYLLLFRYMPLHLFTCLFLFIYFFSFLVLCSFWNKPRYWVHSAQDFHLVPTVYCCCRPCYVSTWFVGVTSRFVLSARSDK